MEYLIFGNTLKFYIKKAGTIALALIPALFCGLH